MKKSMLPEKNINLPQYASVFWTVDYLAESREREVSVGWSIRPEDNDECKGAWGIRIAPIKATECDYNSLLNVEDTIGVL